MLNVWIGVLLTKCDVKILKHIPLHPETVQQSIIKSLGKIFGSCVRRNLKTDGENEKKN